MVLEDVSFIFVWYWLLIWKMCAEVKTTQILPFKELFLLCYPSCRSHNCLHWEGRAGSGFGGGIFFQHRTHTHTLCSWMCLSVEKDSERAIGCHRVVDYLLYMMVTPCVYFSSPMGTVCVHWHRNVVTSAALAFQFERARERENKNKLVFHFLFVTISPCLLTVIYLPPSPTEIIVWVCVSCFLSDPVFVSLFLPLSPLSLYFYLLSHWAHIWILLTDWTALQPWKTPWPVYVCEVHVLGVCLTKQGRPKAHVDSCKGHGHQPHLSTMST